VVVFAGEKGLGFLLVDEGFGAFQFAAEVAEEFVFLPGVGFGGGELDVGFDVAGQPGELVIGGDAILGGLALAKGLLSGFLIVPEIRVGYTFFEGFGARAFLRGVKDNSERGRCVS